MKKFYYYSLPIFIVIVLFIYGCCSSSGGGGVSAGFQGDSSEIQSRTVRIDSEGRLPTISFPSGATIEASEKNTLQPGIYVTVTEQKISSSNESFFKDITGSNNDYYTYKIVAVLDSSNKKTDVTTVEKPFVVTLPNTQSETGLCYIGIRNSETDPWNSWDGDFYVFRGGAFNSDPLDCRSATRIDHTLNTGGGGGASLISARAVGTGYIPESTSHDVSIGFRVCLMYYNPGPRNTGAGGK
ncbi:MAG: hypothetical protein II961_09000 [Candidatus Riflebacteria bacterium]|nr:hypothetical protein [Candidatus Riflebacteria bacterium]